MTTQARKQKGQTRAEHRFHNPQGAEVKTRDEAFAAQQLDITARRCPPTCKTGRCTTARSPSPSR